MTISHIGTRETESIATRESVENVIERGQGYSILGFKDYQPAEWIWPLVLKEFGNIFGVDKPQKNVMQDVHKDTSKAHIFENLDVKTRTLKEQDAHVLLGSPWIYELTSLLGLGIVDAYNLGYPTFTWRITRPHQGNDFRALHRDVWFRRNEGGPEIFDSSKSKNLQRISAWISLNTVMDKSGLHIVPDSHKSTYMDFQRVTDNGVSKAEIKEDYLKEIKPIYANGPEGSVAVWGQYFLHGGAPNISDQCRISLEFSMCRTEQNYYGAYQAISVN